MQHRSTYKLVLLAFDETWLEIMESWRGRGHEFGFVTNGGRESGMCEREQARGHGTHVKTVLVSWSEAVVRTEQP